MAEHRTGAWGGESAMIRLLTQMVTLTVIVAAIVWVGAWGLDLWQTPIALDASATAAVPARVPRVIADPVQPALSSFSQSLARPLFFEGRRLPSPQPKEVKAEPPKPPPPPSPPPPLPKPVVLPDKIKLVGVVLQGQDLKALIEIPPQPAAWFKLGDHIAEWTITSIEENRVVFSHHSSKSATLALYSDSPSK
jgi:hypothetical protein